MDTGRERERLSKHEDGITVCVRTEDGCEGTWAVGCNASVLTEKASSVTAKGIMLSAKCSRCCLILCARYF